MINFYDVRVKSLSKEKIENHAAVDRKNEALQKLLLQENWFF